MRSEVGAAVVATALFWALWGAMAPDPRVEPAPSPIPGHDGTAAVPAHPNDVLRLRALMAAHGSTTGAPVVQANPEVRCAVSGRPDVELGDLFATDGSYLATARFVAGEVRFHPANPGKGWLRFEGARPLPIRWAEGRCEPLDAGFIPGSAPLAIGRVQIPDEVDAAWVQGCGVQDDIGAGDGFALPIPPTSCELEAFAVVDGVVWRSGPVEVDGTRGEGDLDVDFPALVPEAGG
jgi:hypothetical protein